MKEFTLTFSFLLLTIFTLTAQGVKNIPVRKNIINLQIGSGFGYLKDLNYSPLNYSTGGLAVNAGYMRYLKNENILHFSAYVQTGKLKSQVSEFITSDHNNINLEMGLLKNIPINSSKIKFLLGGQYHTYIDLVFYKGTKAITFYVLHSLDLTGSISWDISSRHALSSTISFPVFGLLVRPPWTGWDKYIIDHEYEENRFPLFFRGKWTSLNYFFAVNLNIQYHFAIGPRWDLTAKYLFRYYRTDELKTAIIPSNQFTIGTSFSF